jgi:hypothetical protein
MNSMEPTGLTWPGLALALLGRGAVASLLARHECAVICVFVLLVAAVVALARGGEKLSRAQVAFGRISWWSIPSGLASALFDLSLRSDRIVLVRHNQAQTTQTRYPTSRHGARAIIFLLARTR